MHAPQGLQMLIMKTLHTDGKPGHAGLPEGPEPVLLERPRVGLQGDLGTGLQFDP